jgi:hypothetical protein
MATTTPNFGWPVPTSTDYVKDGATAIEALGDSIDASLLDLKGGTTAQVLSKNSATDMDFTWITNTNVIPATAPISGSYYLSPGSSVGGSTAVVNTTYYLPILVPVTTTFDRIACMSFTSFSGTASVRLGIYNNSNGAPGTVLLDAGTVAITAASTMSAITISQSLSPGIYFMAANTVTAATTNTFYRYSNSAGNPLLGANRTNISTANAFEGFSQSVNVTSGFATAVSPALSTTLSIMTAIRAV